MKAVTPVDLKDGKEHKLWFRVRDVIEKIEKPRGGRSFYSIFPEQESFDTAALLLWAGLSHEQGSKYTLNDATVLLEGYIENGGDLGDLYMTCAKAFLASGLLKVDDRANGADPTSEAATTATPASPDGGTTSDHESAGASS